MASAVASSLIASLEPVTLLEASRRAHRLSDEARARMAPWVEAAQARFKVARELRDRESQRVTLGLLRDTCFFALCGLEAAAAEPRALPVSAAEAWRRFESRTEPLLGAPEGLAEVRAAFSVEEPLALDRVEPRLANELRLNAESTAAWLLSHTEIRAPVQLARARLVRSALAVAGLVVAVLLLVTYGLSLGALEPR
jgi:hypothetical protein